jgi:hypothetical protein
MLQIMACEGSDRSLGELLAGLLEEGAGHLNEATEYVETIEERDRALEQADAVLMVVGITATSHPLGPMVSEYCHNARFVLSQPDPLLAELRYETLAGSLRRLASQLRLRRSPKETSIPQALPN